MQMLRKGFFIVLTVISLLLQGCYTCEQEVDVVVIEPVYIEPEEFIKQVKSNQPRALLATGKIYVKDSLLLINEPNSGIHVVDNSDPYSPLQLAFISIPGNTELAMRNDHLFVNSGPDLLRLDISDPMNATIVSRISNVFSVEVPAELIPNHLHYRIEPVDDNAGRHIGYEEKTIKEKVPCRYL